MNTLRNTWLSVLTAFIASVALFIASTECALANGLDGMPIETEAVAWHQADHALPEPVPLAFVDVQPEQMPADAVVQPDVPEVAAAPMAGGMTKAVLVLLALVAVLVFLAVGLLVLFIVDLTTDFDLFPQN